MTVALSACFASTPPSYQHCFPIFRNWKARKASSFSICRISAAQGEKVTLQTPPDKIEGILVDLILLPYTLVSTTISVAKQVFGKDRGTVKAPPAPTPKSEPAPHGASSFLVADLVHSQIIDNQTVRFYLYHTIQTIRVSTRIRGFQRDCYFTAAMALERKSPFNIDAAICWCREVGFRDAAPAAPNVPNKPQPVKAAQSCADPAVKSPAPVKPDYLGNARSAKSRPFTGKIVEMGESTRTNADKKTYLTYAIKLQSESGSIEKEFIGEHLGVLATEMALRVGQLVKIELLGKMPFEVVVKGVPEQRVRNEYSIQIIH